jgi:hypothetical protein
VGIFVRFRAPPVDLLKSRGGEHIQVFGGAAASLSGRKSANSGLWRGASSAEDGQRMGSRHDHAKW